MFSINLAPVPNLIYQTALVLEKLNFYVFLIYMYMLREVNSPFFIVRTKVNWGFEQVKKNLYPEYLIQSCTVPNLFDAGEKDFQKFFSFIFSK